MKSARILMAFAFTAMAAPALAQEMTSAGGALLRGLDRLSGATSELELKNGETAQLGSISISLEECRYPTGSRSSNAYAYLVIRQAGAEEPVFKGWMIATSPALNALDHPRYDIWVLRCTTS